MYFKISFNTLSDTVHFEEIKELIFLSSLYGYSKVFKGDENKEALSFFNTIKLVIYNMKFLKILSHDLSCGNDKKEKERERKLNKFYKDLISFSDTKSILNEVNEVLPTGGAPLLQTTLIKRLLNSIDSFHQLNVYSDLLDTSENEREDRLSSIIKEIEKEEQKLRESQFINMNRYMIDNKRVFN